MRLWAVSSVPTEAVLAAVRLQALVLFVSESGICRAPLAAAACRQHLQSSQIQEWVEVQARVRTSALN
jgi:hypothetical protein